MKKLISVVLSLAMIFLPILVIQSSAVGNTIKTCELKKGDIVKLGTYPQSLVCDSITLQLLSIKGSVATWNSYSYMSGKECLWNDGSAVPSDYMKYCDVTLDGIKYRGVLFDTYRPIYVNYNSNTNDDISYQYKNGYEIKQTYWFKYEPIEWKVLDNEKGLLISESIIDSQPFNNYLFTSGTKSYKDNSYTVSANQFKESFLMEWLNNDFYKLAFSESESCIINLTERMNGTYSDIYFKSEGLSFVSVPNYKDMVNSDYGFCEEASKNDICRTSSGTDYSKIQGLRVGSSKDDYGFLASPWWLSTAGVDDDDVCFTDENGILNTSMGTDNTSCGIRPIINIKIDENTTIELSNASAIIIENGRADVKKAEKGTAVSIIANSPSENEMFDRWICNDTDIIINNPTSRQASFIMTDDNVFIKASYCCLPPIVPEPSLRIAYNPGIKHMDYKSSIIIFADSSNIPDDSKIVWYVGENEVAQGDYFYAKKIDEDCIITVKLLDSSGIVIQNDGVDISDSISIDVDNSFFAKIKYFLRELLSSFVC